MTVIILNVMAFGAMCWVVGELLQDIAAWLYRQTTEAARAKLERRK